MACPEAKARLALPLAVAALATTGVTRLTVMVRPGFPCRHRWWRRR